MDALQLFANIDKKQQRFWVIVNWLRDDIMKFNLDIW